MMTDQFPKRPLLLVLGLFLVTGTALAQSAEQPKKKATSPAKPASTVAPPALEPRAIELLKASSDRLAAAHTMAFTAVETYESPSRQGHPLVFANKFEVTLQRPDKLRVITPGDGPASEFYYNGKTMTAYRTGGEPDCRCRCSAHDRRSHGGELSLVGNVLSF